MWTKLKNVIFYSAPNFIQHEELGGGPDHDEGQHDPEGDLTEVVDQEVDRPRASSSAEDARRAATPNVPVWRRTNDFADIVARNRQRKSSKKRKRADDVEQNL